MSANRRWSGRLGVVLMLALVASGCGRGEEPGGGASPGLGTVEAGKLTVGSDIPFAPFEFEKDGKLTGFDVELMEEIARRLDLSVTWVDTEFDTIFTQLAAGRFDAVASATTVTDERKRQVAFTDSYLVAKQALTINGDKTPNIRSVNDLKAGDSVAVQEGTTGQTWAQANLAPKGIQVRSFPDAPDTYTTNEAGAVTAVLFDEASAVAETGKRPSLRVVQTIETGERYGFPVNPANRRLLEAMNDALGDIIDDGTYRKIYDSYPELGAGGDITKAGA